MSVIHVLPSVQGQNNIGTYQSNRVEPDTSTQNNTSQEHWAYLDSGQVNVSKLTQAVARVNKQLANTATKVEFQFDPKSQLYWLNIVNKTTGKVITEMPPQAVRQIVDGFTTSGMLVDMKR